MGASKEVGPGMTRSVSIGMPLISMIICIPLLAQDKGGLQVTSAFGEDKTSKYQFDPAIGLKMADAFDVPEWIDCEKLVSIRWPVETSASTAPLVITLINGDLLYGSILSESSTAVIFEGIFGKLAIRLDHIGHIGHARVKSVRNTGKIDVSKGDVLRLSNGDEDTGRLIKIGPQSITFRSTLVQMEKTIPLGEIQDIYLQPTERYRPLRTSTYVEACLVDGSIIKGELLEVSPQRIRIKAELDSLGSLHLKVSCVNFRNGAAVYLSDLDPDQVKERAYLATAPTFSFRKDLAAGPEPRPISIGGQAYAKGLGVHSFSELTFNLNGEYRHFSALAGLDDSAEGKGSVVFVVLLDGKEAFRSPLVSGRHWGGDPAPRSIRLDLKGAKRMTLRVECGPDDDVRDRAAWADAKLIR